MTAIPLAHTTTGTNANPKVWRCKSCECVHLHVDHILLTFTQSEFADFAHEVVECYCVQLQPSNLYDIDAHEIELLSHVKTSAESDAR